MAFRSLRGCKTLSVISTARPRRREHAFACHERTSDLHGARYIVRCALSCGSQRPNVPASRPMRLTTNPASLKNFTNDSGSLIRHDCPPMMLGAEPFGPCLQTIALGEQTLPVIPGSGPLPHLWSVLGCKPHGPKSPFLAISGCAAHRGLGRLFIQLRTSGR